MSLKTLIKKGVDAIKKTFNPADTNGGTPKVPTVYGLFQDIEKRAKFKVYQVSAEDWYKTYPYVFKITTKDNKKILYSLPIPPEALSYQMVSASQLTPTLGGVVEETSATVFWQISLSGTTGIAVSRQYEPKAGVADKLSEMASKEESFRKVLKGGLLANTANKVANAYDAITGAAQDGWTGAVGLLEGLASSNQRFNTSAIKTKLPKNDGLSATANFFNIDLSGYREGVEATNGYVEIHLLHNFLNAYSQLKEIEPEAKLSFQSQKDNMEWQVILKGFSFQKNANQPYLYRYNIALQGFDLKDATSEKKDPVDRFGADGDLGSVSSLTATGALERANGLGSKLSSVKGAASLFTSTPKII